MRVRDLKVEEAEQKLAFVYSKADKLAREWFGVNKREHPMAWRITVLALMKMVLSVAYGERTRD